MTALRPSLGSSRLRRGFPPSCSRRPPPARWQVPQSPHWLRRISWLPRTAPPDPRRAGADGVRDFARALWVGGFETLAHRRRGLGYELQVEMARKGRPQAEACRKLIIALGAIDQAHKAAFGKLRADIADGNCHVEPARP